MEFWKMDGTGNDFILLNDWDRRLEDARLPALARRVCERRLSLGADGLMVVRPPEAGGDFRMLFFNADGSVGEMCGNGARCVCRYGSETGLADAAVQRVETTAGLVTGWRVDRRTWRVRLNDPTLAELSRPAAVDGVEYDCAYVELGDPGIPHVVLRMDGLRDAGEAALRDLGRKLRFHPAFPRGANVNFYEPVAPGRVYLRTYERGVEDFTYACGTGTGSTAVVLALAGLLPDNRLEAEMRGGVLRVDVDLAGGTVRNLWLTGPTNVAAKGALTDEALADLLPP